jgi:hypothetical protein
MRKHSTNNETNYTWQGKKTLGKKLDCYWFLFFLDSHGDILPGSIHINETNVQATTKVKHTQNATLCLPPKQDTSSETPRQPLPPGAAEPTYISTQIKSSATKAQHRFLPTQQNDLPLLLQKPGTQLQQHQETARA